MFAVHSYAQGWLVGYLGVRTEMPAGLDLVCWTFGVLDGAQAAGEGA